jgi:hypothetical protein
MNLLQRIVAAAVATAAAVSLAAMPANAGSREFKDGDRPGQDIASMDVWYSDSSLMIATDVGKIKARDLYTAWVDTNPKDAGPEYKMEMLPNSDYLDLRRVGSFSDKGKVVTAKQCPNFTGWADIFEESGWTAFEIDRKCLGNAKQVRVSFRAKFANKKVGTDWIPGGKKFTPWVKYN